MENKNVSLLPFDSIAQTACKLMQYGLSWDQVGDIRLRLFDVTLSIAPVQKPSEPDMSLFIPVWIFKYTLADDAYTEPGGFALSAIDGSRVLLFPVEDGGERLSAAAEGPPQQN